MPALLLVSFKQAVRSTTLIILPLSFISLVAWATAGSSTGNTADPLRAATDVSVPARNHHRHAAGVLGRQPIPRRAVVKAIFRVLAGALDILDRR
mgnify:CR=1 FL=1